MDTHCFVSVLKRKSCDCFNAAMLIPIFSRVVLALDWMVFITGANLAAYPT